MAADDNNDKTEDNDNDENSGPVEIAVVGDLTENESAVTEKFLEVETGGECTIYFDSPGGSAYCALSLMTLILVRKLRAVGIVTGECSSAALWPFAACQERFVSPYSVLLFHPMKWQSEEHVGLAEATEWARHFGVLEKEMDQLLAQMLGVPSALLDEWVQPGRYVSGRELAEAGIAQLLDIGELAATNKRSGSCSPDRADGIDGDSNVVGQM